MIRGDMSANGNPMVSEHAGHYLLSLRGLFIPHNCEPFGQPIIKAAVYRADKFAEIDLFRLSFKPFFNRYADLFADLKITKGIDIDSYILQ